jgi:hypothetical protein
MMENTALRHVPVGTVLQSDGVFVPFWTGSSLIVGKEGGPIPWALRSPDLTPLYIFVCGFVKDIV